MIINCLTIETIKLLGKKDFHQKNEYPFIVGANVNREIIQHLFLSRVVYQSIVQKHPAVSVYIRDSFRKSEHVRLAVECRLAK